MRSPGCAALPERARRARHRAHRATLRPPTLHAGHADRWTIALSRTPRHDAFRAPRRSPSLQCVADGPACLFAANEAIARFLAGPLHDEGEAHGLEAALRVECIQ